MTAILGDEVVRYLAAQVAGLTAGTNIFVGRIPDQPETSDAAVGVVETGGTSPLLEMLGGSAPNLKVDRPSFQVRVRDPDYPSGYARCQAIYKALQDVIETTLVTGGSTYHTIWALHSPAYLGRDAVQRHEWSQNFLAHWENPNL